MTERRRHLLRSRGRAACGVTQPVLTTRTPSEVDCRACARTIYMADAEAELAQRQPRRRRHKSGPAGPEDGATND